MTQQNQEADFLAELRAANRTRQVEWPANEEIDLSFRGLEFANEAGELAGAVKKLIRAQRGIAGGDATIEEVMDEAGDVLITLDLLLDEVDLKIEPCARRKFNKTTRKNGLTTFLPENGEAFPKEYCDTLKPQSKAAAQMNFPSLCVGFALGCVVAVSLNLIAFAL